MTMDVWASDTSPFQRFCTTAPTLGARPRPARSSGSVPQVYAGRIAMIWSLVIVVGGVESVDNSHRRTSRCMKPLWSFCGWRGRSQGWGVDGEMGVHRPTTATPVVFRNIRHFVHSCPQALVDDSCDVCDFERLSTGRLWEMWTVPSTKLSTGSGQWGRLSAGHGWSRTGLAVHTAVEDPVDTVHNGCPPVGTAASARSPCGVPAPRDRRTRTPRGVLRNRCEPPEMVGREEHAVPGPADAAGRAQPPTARSVAGRGDVSRGEGQLDCWRIRLVSSVTWL